MADDRTSDHLYTTNRQPTAKLTVAIHQVQNQSASSDGVTYKMKGSPLSTFQEQSMRKTPTPPHPHNRASPHLAPSSTGSSAPAVVINLQQRSASHGSGGSSYNNQHTPINLSRPSSRGSPAAATAISGAAQGKTQKVSLEALNPGLLSSILQGLPPGTRLAVPQGAGFTISRPASRGSPAPPATCAAGGLHVSPSSQLHLSGMGVLQIPQITLEQPPQAVSLTVPQSTGTAPQLSPQQMSSLSIPQPVIVDNKGLQLLASALMEHEVLPVPRPEATVSSLPAKSAHLQGTATQVAATLGTATQVTATLRTATQVTAIQGPTMQVTTTQADIIQGSATQGGATQVNATRFFAHSPQASHKTQVAQPAMSNPSEKPRTMVHSKAEQTASQALADLLQTRNSGLKRSPVPRLRLPTQDKDSSVVTSSSQRNISSTSLIRQTAPSIVVTSSGHRSGTSSVSLIGHTAPSTVVTSGSHHGATSTASLIGQTAPSVVAQKMSQTNHIFASNNGGTVTVKKPPPMPHPLTIDTKLLHRLTNSGLSPEQGRDKDDKDGIPHLVPEVVLSSSKHNTLTTELASVPELKCEDPKTPVTMESPFNQRVVNLSKFPLAQTSYRATYRSHAVAIQRAKAGSITSAAKSLDILRSNLQKECNKEIDVIIQKYMEMYFKPAIENIRSNNGENAVTEEHIQAVSRQILEEAKKMYFSESRSVTPDISDNVSETGSLVENPTVRANKQSLFNIKKRRGSSDSDVSINIPRKKKKGRPPLHASGRSTPSKTAKTSEPVKREGAKWDPARLTPDVLFVMGARANKALGLGQTRGRLYIKHPEIFKYSGDQEDKLWLHEKHHVPISGGKAYLLVVDDIKELAESDEYRNNPGLMMNELIGFTVPDFMLAKMSAQMQAMRTDNPKPQPQKLSRSNTPTILAQDESGHVEMLFGDEAELDPDPPLPFTSLQHSTGKTLPIATKTGPGPQFDLLSAEQDEDGPLDVSPFHVTMETSFDSPAQETSPAPSDMGELEEDAPLTVPFDLSD